MNDHELENQLTAVFARRAAEIEDSPRFDFSSTRAGRSRLNLTPFAAAASVAAVVVVAGGSVVGIRSLHRGPDAPAVASVSVTPTPTSRPTTCQQVRDRTAWQTPIDAGTKVALDHPDNSVVSVNGRTGEYLLLQTTPNTGGSQAPFEQATLAVFRRAIGQDVAALPAGSPDFPVTDPSGAISADWISYGLAHPQSAGFYYKVMLYNRRTQATVTLDEVTDSDYQDGRAFSAPPVIFGDTVYWIQSVYADHSKSMLKSYELPTGRHDSIPVPGATSLVNYGTGVASVDGTGTDSTFTTRVGASLPTRVVAELQGASSYSYDAASPTESGSGTLHWVTVSSSQGRSMVRYYDNSVGAAGFDYLETSKLAINLTIGTGPFVPIDPIDDRSDGGAQIMDGRSGLTRTLPNGDDLQAVVGDEALFGTGVTKFGASGLVLVKVSALPEQTAGC